jgi:hypothetical protein
VEERKIQLEKIDGKRGYLEARYIGQTTTFFSILLFSHSHWVSNPQFNSDVTYLELVSDLTVQGLSPQGFPTSHTNGKVGPPYFWPTDYKPNVPHTPLLFH